MATGLRVYVESRGRASASSYTIIIIYFLFNRLRAITIFSERLSKRVCFLSMFFCVILVLVAITIFGTILIFELFQRLASHLNFE